MSVLSEQLFDEISQARSRVYAVGQPTPLQELTIRDVKSPVFVKREDLGPIKAYKWRGAYNAMATLSSEDLSRGVVAASAGNHAQGVALAARILNCHAQIFMPRSTPEVKQLEVKRHGQDHVTVVLYGNSFDETANKAQEYCSEHNAVFIHPYDTLETMGGQGTMADEVVMSGKGPFNRVYVPIGGGGLAAATACWMKHHCPEIKVIGVEGVDQASMKTSIESGKRTELSYVDVFCDGTAVRTPGEKTYELCRELIDEYITVTNNEVCHAIRTLWESSRLVPEPSGALSMAGFLNEYRKGLVKDDEKSLVIISGANMDFTQLSQIAKQAGIGSHETYYLRIAMEAKRGQVLKYLRNLPPTTTLVDVQYGKTNGVVQYPVFGVSATEADMEQIHDRLQEKGIWHEHIDEDEDVRFRMIHYDTQGFRHPLFVHIEFPERPGAFLEFMEHIADVASICYFNYEYSGERVGRALVGLEFDSQDDHNACIVRIRELPHGIVRAAREIAPETFNRIMGNSPGA